jgi:PAS domain S-box-containing protein
LFGYRAEQVIGWRSIRLFPESQWEAHEVILRRALAGEVHGHVEIDIRRRDGLIVPALLTVSPVRDGGGRVIGASVIARDLSEQKEAQATLAESEARLREGESLAHVGGWVFDVATGSVQWSAELHRIHGVEPIDFDGTLAAHLAPAHDEDRPRLEAALAAAVRTQEPVDTEYRIVRPGHRVRWLYTRANPVVDASGSVIGLRGICQDVTDRNAAQQAMQEAYERERAAAEGLRAADQLKDEFLSTVSHELRTPLTAIIGFAQLLRRGIDPAHTPDLVERIQRNADEMRGMVERVLDFSRLQAGEVDLRLTEVALDELVRTTVGDLAGATLDRPVKDSAGSGARVVADPEATAHVLANLVLNAAKFSPAGSVIEVTTTVAGGEAVVMVVDQGPGVPAELRERVFDRFFQGADQPPGKRGTGVGLAIVRRYVELQGGRAWCEETDPGPGATFCFTLPLAPRQGEGV